LILAKVGESGRRWRKKLGVGRKVRSRGAPWRTLAALVGVAAAWWFAADLHPDAVGSNGALVLRGSGAGAPGANVAVALKGSGAAATNRNGALAADGNGVFTLCMQASQQNCVVDGDTIRYGGTKIRLEEIDAPEVFSPQCPSEAALGRRATRRLLELMNAGAFDVVSGGRDTDRYGRKLRTIERAGRSVGDTLVAEGLARRWDGARRSWCG
jgi:endonuclease YncB( thermonuclease family)